VQVLNPFEDGDRDGNIDVQEVLDIDSDQDGTATPTHDAGFAAPRVAIKTFAQFTFTQQPCVFYVQQSGNEDVAGSEIKFAVKKEGEWLEVQARKERVRGDVVEVVVRPEDVEAGRWEVQVERV
jgi:hypothetical protein